MMHLLKRTSMMRIAIESSLTAPIADFASKKHRSEVSLLNATSCHMYVSTI